MLSISGLISCNCQKFETRAINISRLHRRAYDKKKHSQASVLVTLIVINMGQLQNGDIVEVLVTSVFESLLPVVDLWKLNTDK